MSAAHRQGWCPGALRPMQSGDGLIVRLRIIGGEITPALANALAQCAEDFGSGQIDVTSRANLQLRGVTDATLAPLQARLDALGLLDDDAAVESIRNILLGPLAGIDPTALIDVRPFAEALNERLKRDRALHALPGKFLFLIDNGGRLPLPTEKSDIAFVANTREGRNFFAVCLGGVDAGFCAPDEMCDTAVRLALAFLDLRENESRMRDLVRRVGTAEVMRRAAVAPSLATATSPPVRTQHILGLHQLGRKAALGLGLPFGRIDALRLRRLAEAASESSGLLRLSPWRAIFLVAEEIPPALTAKLGDAGFVLDDAAPIRSVAACPGRPACLHGETDSRIDAARLAPFARKLVADGIALHVSACAKGCAHAARATVTLVGRDGRYDVVIDGRTDGAPILYSLNVSEVEDLLHALVEIAPANRGDFVRRRLCETAR
jgi:precorrin-3B synthase